MKAKHIIKLVHAALLLLLCGNATAQSFLGLSVNYGDKLNFSPDYPNLLLQRRSFSPTLVYSNQKRLYSDFAIIFGGQAGVAGYQLISVLRDTLGPSGDRTPFPDYGIFVARVEATPGKLFHIGKKELFIGIGGGVSYYLGFPFSTMGIFGEYQGTGVRLFSAYVEFQESGTFRGFAKIYTKMALSKRFDLAFQYSRHWKTILNGEFEFYHTKTPASGTIKLVPQGVSLILLYRLKKID